MPVRYHLGDGIPRHALHTPLQPSLLGMENYSETSSQQPVLPPPCQRASLSSHQWGHHENELLCRRLLRPLSGLLSVTVTQPGRGARCTRSVSGPHPQGLTLSSQGNEGVFY